MSNGYIKLHRKTLDGGMLKNHKLWAFWSYCLLKAKRFRKKETIGYQEIWLEPGQFIFGRKQAASDLNMSEQSVRTCLNSLKLTSNLKIESTNKFSIITIINWDIYQGKEPDINQQTPENFNQQINQQNGQQNNQQSNQQKINNNNSLDVTINQQLTNKKTGNQPANQQTTNQQLTTNKNDKNKIKYNIYNKQNFAPPGQAEVIEYFQKCGYNSTHAKKFWRFYENGNPPWHDAAGKPVLSWKQKAEMWFKDENRIKPATPSRMKTQNETENEIFWNAHSIYKQRGKAAFMQYAKAKNLSKADIDRIMNPYNPESKKKSEIENDNVIVFSNVIGNI